MNNREPIAQLNPYNCRGYKKVIEASVADLTDAVRKALMIKVMLNPLRTK